MEKFKPKTPLKPEDKRDWAVTPLYNFLAHEYVKDLI